MLEGSLFYSPVISVQNLSHSFGHRQILKNISFQLDAGERYAILGESGCGKSVLLSCIMGLINYQNGSATINGLNLRDLSEQQRSRSFKDIAILFQAPALWTSLSLFENIGFHDIFVKKIPIKETRKKVESLCERFQFSLNKQSIDGLSEGEKKYAALLRAIMKEPKILIGDEMTTGLDPESCHRLTSNLRKFLDETQTTLISVTHNLDEVVALNQNCIFLNNQEIVWKGTIDDLPKAPSPYIRTYLQAYAEIESSIL